MDLVAIIDRLYKMPEESRAAIKARVKELYYPKGHILLQADKVEAATLSFGLLIKATQSLPMGTAYAVWTGIGAVGTVIIGILIFKDPANFWRLFFIATLIGSIVGLKVVSH